MGIRFIGEELLRELKGAGFRPRERKKMDYEKYNRTMFWLMVFIIICNAITIAIRVAELAGILQA